jgi:hypothetical protein
MFLTEKQIIKSKEVSLVQLESLLDALVKETNTLTESQIEDVTYIQNSILENSKLVLSEDASVKYQEFIEKVMLFDDSLNEGIINKLFKSKYRVDINNFPDIDIANYVEKYIKLIDSDNNESDRKDNFKHLLSVLEKKLKEAEDFKNDYKELVDLEKKEQKKNGNYERVYEDKYSEKNLREHLRPSIYYPLIAIIKQKI